jgi:hypothetical protein
MSARQPSGRAARAASEGQIDAPGLRSRSNPTMTCSKSGVSARFAAMRRLSQTAAGPVIR